MPLTLEHKHHVFIVCVVGIFITVFDTSSSIVALPTIAHEFATGLPTAQWVIIGNGLTIAALLVPMGRLSDLVGRKRIYVVGALIFAVGALFAAWSSTIASLIAARVLVGVGSAMTQGTAMAILVGNFEAKERAKMLGLQIGVVGLGGIVGPALGGLLTGTIGWRMLFAITAAAMLAISLTAQRTLRRRAKRPPAERPFAASFDYWGAFTFSTFLLGALLTLTLGPDIGWLDPLTLAGIAGSALMLVLFLASERRSASPMLDLHLFRKAELSLGALAALVTFMGLAATRFLVPFFLQAVKGYSAAQVGLTIVPAAVVTAVAAPFAGRLADRFGVRFFANIGMAVTLLGFAAFTTLTTVTPVWAVVAGLMLMSLGMSVFGAANSASILNTVDADAHGVASALVTLCRNSGNVVGIAFATVIVTLTMGADGYQPSLAAVDPTADPGILTAFTHGVGVAAIALTVIALVVLAILVAWSWRAALARDSAS